MDYLRSKSYHVRLLLLAFLIVFTFGCEPNKENKEVEIKLVPNNLQKEDSLVTSSLDNSLGLVLEIDREQVRKLNTSIAQIASKISKIQDAESELSPEELLSERLTFRDNNGKIVSIPLRSVIDTFYYE